MPRKASQVLGALFVRALGGRYYVATMGADKQVKDVSAPFTRKEDANAELVKMRKQQSA